MWFWILVLGIILTIVGVVIWIVTGQANIAVGLLLGAGVAWIVAGLLFWIFGRPKAPPQPKPEQSTPIATSQYTLATQPAKAPVQPTVTTQPSVTQTQTMSPSQQQQLLQLLQSNPQLLSAYASGSQSPTI